MFEIGDYIIYGSNGVCKVEEIGSMNMHGIPKERLYYTLIPVYAIGSRFFTPADNNKVIMRPVISKEDALSMINGIKDLEIFYFVDEKQKENIYKEALKTCDCKEWIKIIKTAYVRKQSRKAEGKEITASDKKYLDLAEESLCGELALSLEMEKEELKKIIAEKVNDFAINV